MDNSISEQNNITILQYEIYDKFTTICILIQIPLRFCYWKYKQSKVAIDAINGLSSVRQ